MLINANPAPPDEGPGAGTAVFPLRRHQRFLSVGAVAAALGMSEATIYRAVRSGEFPAVRIRNRYVIPVKVLDLLERSALTTGATVDAADWADDEGTENL